MKSSALNRKGLQRIIKKEQPTQDEDIHELSFYSNDRVKLMKEVLKILKPDKIKSMAPYSLKELDSEDINSMLLEELLGISNKRLKYILNGQNVDEDSSSSSTEVDEEVQPVDVISLDDISDDDLQISITNRKETASKSETRSGSKKDDLSESKLMNVLELLELQARARAIRSQLALEASRKLASPIVEESNVVAVIEDTDEVAIVEVDKREEIVITSSDDETVKENVEKHKAGQSSDVAGIFAAKSSKNTDAPVCLDEEILCNDDAIVIEVDQEEMESIIRDS